MGLPQGPTSVGGSERYGFIIKTAALAAGRRTNTFPSEARILSSPSPRQVPSDLTIAPPKVKPVLLSRDGADKRSTEPFRKGNVGSIVTMTSKFGSLLMSVI